MKILGEFCTCCLTFKKIEAVFSECVEIVTPYKMFSKWQNSCQNQCSVNKVQ
jgi:hypothetical protein